MRCTCARRKARASKQTERVFAAVEAEIRRIIPPQELDTDPGQHRPSGQRHQPGLRRLPSTIGRFRRRHPDFAEAESTVRTEEYQRILRKRLRADFPEETFFFAAANITNQILNFGLPAPIDIQVVGRDASRITTWPSQIARPGGGNSRRRGRAHQPGGAHARRAGQRRPHQGQPGRPHAARCRQQHADFAQLQRPGGAQSVAESRHRRQLPRYRCRRRNTASIPSTRCSSTPITRLQPTAPARNCWGTCPRSDARRPRTRSSATTMCSRSSMSTPVHGSARPGRRRRATSTRSSTHARANCPQATDHRVRGQVETMQTSFSRLGFGMLVRDPAGVPADGRQLPVVAGSVHHPHGASRARWPASCGCCSSTQNHSQRSVPDGRDHGDRRGDRQQYSGGRLSPTTSAPTARTRSRRRFRPASRAFARSA